MYSTLYLSYAFNFIHLNPYFHEFNSLHTILRCSFHTCFAIPGKSEYLPTDIVTYRPANENEECAIICNVMSQLNQTGRSWHYYRFIHHTNKKLNSWKSTKHPL